MDWLSRISCRENHPFVTLEISQLQHSKSFSILPLLEKFSYEFLDELLLGFPILLGDNLLLSVSFQKHDSHSRAPYDETECVCSIRGKECLHCLPSESV